MKLRFERVLLAIAVIAAASSAVGFRFAYSKLGKLGAGARKPVRVDIPYARREVATPAISEVKWTDPVRSTTAGKWTYDLFTPPEIFYDAVSKRFTVSPPRTTLGANEMASDSREEPLIQLLEVKPTLYRLQLIGYVGTKNGYLGLFENAATHETFLAAAKRDLSELDLDIESFAVELATIALPDGMSTRQPIATAAVRDHLTHKLISLTTVQRCYVKPRAVVCLDRGTPQEVCTGDVLNLNGTDYEVGEVQLSPPRVAMRRVAKNDVASELLTLEMTPTTPASAASPSI